MLGGNNRALWYLLGQSDAESQRQADRTADMFFGRSPVVEVRQSYIDDLHTALQRSRINSDKNYAAGETWMIKANRLEAELARANAIIAEQDARIRQDKELKKSLEENNLQFGSFVYVLTRIAEALLNAADSGKSGRPDYQAFKQFAYKMFDAYHRKAGNPDCPVQIDDEYFELEKSLKR
jgi:hypothetical protein